MTTPPGTVSAGLLLPLVVVARKHGLDADALCEEAGLDLATLEDPEARVSHSTLGALTGVVASRVNNPSLGLELARLYELSPQDPMGRVMMASRTLREGYSRVLRYQRLWDDQDPFGMVPCEGGVRLVFAPSSSPVLPFLRVNAEWVLGSLLRSAHLLTGQSMSPLWVHFQHETPPDPSVYEQYFGVPVTFGAPSMEMALCDSMLDHPLTHAHALLLSFFEKHAEAKVTRLPSFHLLSERVRTVLRGALGGGDCSVKAVAAKLRMSPRTLQRRLKEEGTHHEKLLEELRKELAGDYLGRRLDIAEVSFLLGYANPTAFHRAFKRWMGESPEQYRARQAASR